MEERARVACEGAIRSRMSSDAGHAPRLAGASAGPPCGVSRGAVRSRISPKVAAPSTGLYDLLFLILVLDRSCMHTI